MIIVVKAPIRDTIDRPYIISIQAYGSSEASAAYTRIANLVLPLMVPHLPKGERPRMVMQIARMQTRTHTLIHLAMAITILHPWLQPDEDPRLLNVHMLRRKKYGKTR